MRMAREGVTMERARARGRPAEMLARVRVDAKAGANCCAFCGVLGRVAEAGRPGARTGMRRLDARRVWLSSLGPRVPPSDQEPGKRAAIAAVSKERWKVEWAGKMRDDSTKPGLPLQINP